jgi:hypothetical protein
VNKEEHLAAVTRPGIAVRCLLAFALCALALALACGSARAAVPGTPTDVTAFPADGSAGVSFTAPTQPAGTLKVTGYTVTSTPGGITQTGTTSPIVVHGLTNGTAYQFTVHATNSDGDSPESSVSNFVIPVDDSGSVIGLSSKGAFALILALVVVFALVSGFFMFYDRMKTYPAYQGLVGKLVDQTKDSLTADQLAAVMKEVRRPPRFASGLTRTIIALGLLALVGVTLVALLVGDSANASDLLKAVVTAVLTAFTTVLGFYFGSKTAADAAENPAKPNGGGSAPVTTAGGVPPDKPTNVHAVVDGGTVKVTFLAPANQGSSAIENYTATSNPAGLRKVNVGTEIRFDGLTPGVQYRFTVHATNASGNSPESDPSETVTAPT